MKTTNLLLAGLLAAAACTGALAQDTPPDESQIDEAQMDAAQMDDGQMEEAPIDEAQMVQAQAPEAQIEAATGPVTVNSVQPPIGNASDYRVKVADIDANGDGVLSKKEVPTDHALFFEFRLVDSNRNGRITDEELANWK